MLVSRQAVFEQRRQYQLNLATIYQNEVDNLNQGSNIYSNGSDFTDDEHYYTADLDIFGQSSLYQLVNRCATAKGRQLLANWFKAPAAHQQIIQRQQAVTELAQQPNFKPQLQASLLFASTQTAQQVSQLQQYLSSPLHLPQQKWLKLYSAAAPYVLLLAVAICYTLHLPYYYVTLLGLFNLRTVFNKAKYIKKTDLLAGKIGQILNQYAQAIQQIETQNWQAARLQALQQQLNTQAGHNISVAIKQLSILINKLNYHLNIVVGVMLNITLLWDIRQVIAIEEWRQHNEDDLNAAFEVIAEVEALLSIAVLHQNHPQWAIPHITAQPGYVLQAQAIAHPLIKRSNRVSNHYQMSQSLGVDIITGSNMAGKSTFLRTLGINLVLALAGAPVCAESMQTSVMQVVSYMRIRDSLNESTSTFKAELNRLKMILDTVQNQQQVLFLIDEMLRGTNSVDKYRGSKAVIEKLISLNGVGLDATHDLQIARLEDEYPQRVRNFYFDIQVKDGEMLFDYQLKTGQCHTFNASLLLKQMGINVPPVTEPQLHSPIA
jgi:DNA mismatch repair ATPase MutS